MRSRYFNRVQELYCAETRCKDNGVVLVMRAVFELDAGFRDTTDFVALKGCLGAGNGGVIIVGYDDALATWTVVWGEFRPEVGLVGDLRLHHLYAAASDDFCKLAAAVCYGVIERLAKVHHVGSDAPANWGKVAQYCAFEGADGPIETWNDPIWSSLVDCQ